MDLILYLQGVVAMLAGEIGVRSYRDIDRLEKTAFYISEQFASFGYQVTKHPFLFAGTTYHSISAELTGGSSPGTILVVGAHYDSARTTPGADDNASGVAGLLALARTLAGKKLERTVRFVAFALEEWPVYRSVNMASYHYARSLKERDEHIAGMICLEMIGYFCDREGSQHYPFPFMNLKFPKTGNYIAMVGNRRSKKFTEQIAGSFSKSTDLPLITLNAPAIMIGIDFSDHWSFNKLGYKAFMVTDTAFYRNPHYHAPSDLSKTLDYERMAKVVEGLIGAVEEWGGR